MSVRRLAELAEVSNPYLSQIERGLRKPSAEILQQIARALRISAEQLYVRAGILDPNEAGLLSVPDAINLDPAAYRRAEDLIADGLRELRQGRGERHGDVTMSSDDA